MAFTLRDADYVRGGYGDSTTVVSNAVSVSVGDVIVVSTQQHVSCTATAADTAGNTYTHIGTQITNGGGGYNDLLYSIATSASASNVVTATFSVSDAVQKVIQVVVFNPNGATASYDNAFASVAAYGASNTTGTFSTTGTTEVAVAFTSTEDDAFTVSSPVIGGVAGTDCSDSGTYMHGWYVTFDATQTDITAGCSYGASHWYVMVVAAFKAAATAQFARPAADRTDGSWLNSAGTPDNVALYSYIDETSYSDSDYIRSSASPSSDTCIIDLSSIATPQAGTVTLRVRAKHT